MSTHPAFEADALDDLADFYEDEDAADDSCFHDTLLENAELAQIAAAMNLRAPSMAEFEARFGKIDAAHLTCTFQERHALLASWDRGETLRTWVTVDQVKTYQVDPDSPSAKAARRMRKVEGL